MPTAAQILAATDNSEPQAALRPYIRSDGLTLLVGPEGSGKSSLLSSVAVAVSTGRCTEWARSVRKGPVLWLTQEEDVRVVAKAAEVGGDTALNNIIIESLDGPDLSRVVTLIRRYGPALVVADPLDVLALPSCRSPRSELAPLTGEIIKRGMGVVAVLHTLHGARLGAKLVKGAGDWTRFARSILYYGPDPRLDPLDPAQRSILYHHKSNRGGEQGEAHAFGQDGTWQGSVPGLDLQELLGKPEKKPDAERPGDRALHLLGTLLSFGEPILVSTAEAAAEKLGISRATLHRAAAAIGVIKSERPRSGGRYAAGATWTLPCPAVVSCADVDVDATTSHGYTDDLRHGGGSSEGQPHTDDDQWWARGNLN